MEDIHNLIVSNLHFQYLYYLAFDYNNCILKCIEIFYIQLNNLKCINII